MSSGSDLLILSTGLCTAEILRLESALKSAHVSITHLHIPVLKPAPKEQLIEYVTRKNLKGIITVENHQSRGGLGSVVAELMATRKREKTEKSPRLLMLGVQDSFAQSGKTEYLLRKYGLDVGAIVAGIEQLLGRKLGINIAELPPSPWSSLTEESLPIR